jgi:hypothetical protein
MNGLGERRRLPLNPMEASPGSDVFLREISPLYRAQTVVLPP